MKNEYVSPVVELIEVSVDVGFAASEDKNPVEDPEMNPWGDLPW